MQELSYVLPLRWQPDADPRPLTGYLSALSRRAEVVVVDGSPPPAFDRHGREWRAFVRHAPPDPHVRFLNGKVEGVMTGVRMASNDRVIVADDDVRYEPGPLARTARLLDEAELVWPQNYFDPLPWHALWDTSRTLFNRAFSHDYPGTVGLRRSFLLHAGGYDGNVIFENLELRRTIEAAGGRVATPLDLYVRRLPPATPHFLAQRVRQAYDELAQPRRLAAFLAVLPAAAATLAAGRPEALAAGALAAAALAEIGRRRAGGDHIFPASASLMTPMWVAERAVTSWLAVALRIGRGGVSYGGNRIRRAATPSGELRRRLRARAV